MSQDVVQGRSRDIAKSSFDVLTPLSSRALFWRLEYTEPSTFIEHVPLLFWLVETARPGVAVTLGVADAVPHFALCQAVDKLSLDAQCFGIDLPEEGAGSSELSQVRAYNARHFRGFSDIVNTDVTEAVGVLQDLQIDFLVVNRYVTRALTEELDQNWLPLLSEHALVVFAAGGETAVLPQYARGLVEQGGTFVLDPTRGVQLAVRGEHPDDRLMQLAHLAPDKPGYMPVRSVFARLGELHLNGLKLDEARSELNAIRKQCEAAVEKCNMLTRQNAEYQERAAKLDSTLRDMSDQMAGLRSELFDARTAQTEHQKIAREYDACQQDLERLERSERELQAENERVQNEAKQANKSLEAERDHLKSELRSAEQAHEALEAERDHLTSELRSAEQAREKTDQAAQLAQAAHDQAFFELRATNKAMSKDMNLRLKELVIMTRMLEEREAQIVAAESDKIRLQVLSKQMEHLRVQHTTMMALLGPKTRILLAMEQRRRSKAYRTMRAQLNSQIAEVESSGLFDATWYRETYPDTAALDMAPIEHFIRMGAYEVRNPGPEFDSLEYHLADPAVAEHGLPAIFHYLRYGKETGRKAIPIS